MRKLALTLSAAAFALGAMALSANAQTLLPGLDNLQGQVKNATPIVSQTACRGWGPHCRPGWTWACGPYGRCFCRPCR